MARIGFVSGASRTVSEDAEEVILLIESDGSNVDPVNVSYSLSGSGTAQGSMSLKIFYDGIFISLSPFSISVSLFLSHMSPSLSLDGSDFLLTGVGDLFFPPGAVINSLTVSILDDELSESLESFSIILSPGVDS